MTTSVSGKIDKIDVLIVANKFFNMINTGIIVTKKGRDKNHNNSIKR